LLPLSKKGEKRKKGRKREIQGGTEIVTEEALA
jgi:hypothetical protein